MKKLLCLALLFVFCFSVLSCSSPFTPQSIEDELQGEWACIDKSNSTIISFRNGTVTKTDSSGAVLSGTYTVESSLDVIITYTDNSTQTFTPHAAESIVLLDHTTGLFFGPRDQVES